MIRQIKNAIDTNLTCEEMEILAEADRILCGLQFDLGNKLDMKSLETGEVISNCEFSRVRGILDALSTQRGWELSINKRME